MIWIIPWGSLRKFTRLSIDSGWLSFVVDLLSLIAIYLKFSIDKIDIINIYKNTIILKQKPSTKNNLEFTGLMTYDKTRWKLKKHKIIIIMESRQY